MSKPFEFIDFSVQVTEAMNDALIAALDESAGELHAKTVRNSRQGYEYGDILATALWEYELDADNLKASVGSKHEAGYWEEFGKKLPCRIKIGQNRLNFIGKSGIIFL